MVNKIQDQYTDLPLTRYQKYDLRHPERYNEQIKWRLLHPEQVRASQRKYDKNRRIQKRKTQKIYNQRHPEIIKARVFAYNHFPLNKFCMFGNCDATEQLQRAHISYEDYKNPNSVVTMCSHHHKILDIYYKELD